MTLLFIFNGIFCYMILYPTSRQSQMHFELLPGNGMTILNFVNMAKNPCNLLSLILRVSGAKLTLLMRSIFFLNNMSKLKYSYTTESLKILSNCFIEMLVGIKGRKNKMEGKRKEKTQTVLLVIKSKIYVLEQEKASTKCRSREYESWQAFRFHNSSLISWAGTVCSERLNNSQSYMACHGTATTGGNQEPILNVYSAKSFESIISQ